MDRKESSVGPGLHFEIHSYAINTDFDVIHMILQ